VAPVLRESLKLFLISWPALLLTWERGGESPSCFKSDLRLNTAQIKKPPTVVMRNKRPNIREASQMN